MHIEFEPGRTTLDQARGLVALLLEIHGSAVIPATLSVSCGDISISGAAEAVNAVLTQETPFDVVQDVMGGVDDEPRHGNPAEAFGAPQAVAPTPTTQPATTATPAVDSAGLPWDERIHSSSRATTQDGTWRYRKSVSEDTKRAVEAELKGVPFVPPQTIEITVGPGGSVSGTSGAPAPAAPVAPQPPLSTAPAAPTPPPAPPVSPPAAPTTGLPPFPAFMSRMVPHNQSGKITLTRIGDIAKTLGVETLPDLARQPELIPTLEAMVLAEVGAA